MSISLLDGSRSDKRASLKVAAAIRRLLGQVSPKARFESVENACWVRERVSTQEVRLVSRRRAWCIWQARRSRQSSVGSHVSGPTINLHSRKTKSGGGGDRGRESGKDSLPSILSLKQSLDNQVYTLRQSERDRRPIVVERRMSSTNNRGCEIYRG